MNSIPNTILEIRNLFKEYPGVKAVNGVSLKIEQGLCFGLLGPNGAGKTTTIEMIEGITDPTSGEILYKGEPQGDRFKVECGIQFQHTALPEYLTVIETLKLFQGLYPKSASLEGLIDTCNLGEFLSRDTQQLSGGQRQRLLLAIALVNEPEIVFLDEPTTGLDPQARRNFWELIRSIQARGTTIILSTHYMEEAAELCDEIAIMDRGEIIAQGSPEDLLHQHFSERFIRLPEHAVKGELKGISQPIHQSDGWIDITTTDVNSTITELLEQGVELSQLQVRQCNLEDLFLQLTGKELRA
ncbi:MAG: ABC transporter ATP-binding protein [Gammaproteobacteria bacterium]|nr:ABC transporter ATP-binding protein [Gammaproteobacteria bacterium]MCW8983248.1 ABC transporter ATP-binding protein [Gammaproteobacteria bacterium]